MTVPREQSLRDCPSLTCCEVWTHPIDEVVDNLVRDRDTVFFEQLHGVPTDVLKKQESHSQCRGLEGPGCWDARFEVWGQNGYALLAISTHADQVCIEMDPQHGGVMLVPASVAVVPESMDAPSR